MNETGRRIRFTADFDWKPTPRVTMAYRKGQIAFVTKACANRALELKKAEVVTLPAPPSGIEDTIKRNGRRRRRKKPAANGE
jgi:hypothetical protein